MAGADFLRPVHPQDDLVGQPVRDEVHHGGEQKGDDQAVRPAEHFADDQQQPAQEPEQERRFHTVRHTVILPLTAVNASRRLQLPASRGFNCQLQSSSTLPAISAARHGSASISTCS